MESHEFDLDILRTELEMKSFINAKIKYVLVDLDKNKKYEYYHKNGLVDYIPTIGKSLLMDPVMLNKEIEVTKKKNKFKIDVTVCLAWQKENTEEIRSFCNSLYTSEGGTHVTGFKLGIVNCVKNFIQNNNILSKKDENLEISGDDIRAGLVVAINVKHPNPLYDSGLMFGCL